MDRQHSHAERSCTILQCEIATQSKQGRELKKMLRKTLRLHRSSLLVVAALVLLGALASPPLAFSQSCALCYTQAASAGTRMIQALRSGILILIVPPTFMSVAMIFIVHRKRNQFRQDDDAPESSREW